MSQKNIYQLYFTGSSAQILDWETLFIADQASCYSTYNDTNKKIDLVDSYDQTLQESYMYYVINTCINNMSDKTGFGIVIELLSHKCEWSY